MLRVWIHDIPNDSSVAMVAGMVGFWKGDKVEGVPSGVEHDWFRGSFTMASGSCWPCATRDRRSLGGIEAGEW